MGIKGEVKGEREEKCQIHHIVNEITKAVKLTIGFY